MALDSIKLNLLKEVAGLEKVPEGAYNLRIDGKLEGKNNSATIEIVPKTDKQGIDIYIKPSPSRQRVDLPVLITKSGLKDLVYNDFHIEDGADVLIVAGCGIHNSGELKSEHNGIHSFYVGKNAKVEYVEKHYGAGEGSGQRVLNPKTVIEIQEGGYLEMQTAQIKGVDDTNRVTVAKLDKNATLVIRENLMTHANQTAITDFTVDLNGENSSCHVVSRAVAKDNSKQVFSSLINGNSKCSGHTECDAIIMNNGVVSAIPKVCANHVDASLIHEAVIGKIAGEQLIKLMTLGLTEQEAEEQIVNGFLK